MADRAGERPHRGDLELDPGASAENFHQDQRHEDRFAKRPKNLKDGSPVDLVHARQPQGREMEHILALNAKSELRKRRKTGNVPEDEPPVKKFSKEFLKKFFFRGSKTKAPGASDSNSRPTPQPLSRSLGWNSQEDLHRATPMPDWDSDRLNTSSWGNAEPCLGSRGMQLQQDMKGGAPPCPDFSPPAAPNASISWSASSSRKPQSSILNSNNNQFPMSDTASMMRTTTMRTPTATMNMNMSKDHVSQANNKFMVAPPPATRAPTLETNNSFGSLSISMGPSSVPSSLQSSFDSSGMIGSRKTSENSFDSRRGSAILDSRFSSSVSSQGSSYDSRMMPSRFESRSNLPSLGSTSMSSAQVESMAAMAAEISSTPKPVLGEHEGKGYRVVTIQTDTGRIIKKHQCVFCRKFFAQRSNMIAHIRTHTGEKPFVCFRCDRAFAQKSNLKRHIKSLHMKSTKDNNMNESLNTTTRGGGGPSTEQTQPRPRGSHSPDIVMRQFPSGAATAPSAANYMAQQQQQQQHSPKMMDRQPAGGRGAGGYPFHGRGGGNATRPPPPGSRDSSSNSQSSYFSSVHGERGGVRDRERMMANPPSAPRSRRSNSYFQPSSRSGMMSGGSTHAPHQRHHSLPTTYRHQRPVDPTAYPIRRTHNNNNTNNNIINERNKTNNDNYDDSHHVEVPSTPRAHLRGSARNAFMPLPSPSNNNPRNKDRAFAR